MSFERENPPETFPAAPPALTPNSGISFDMSTPDMQAASSTSLNDKKSSSERQHDQPQKDQVSRSVPVHLELDKTAPEHEAEEMASALINSLIDIAMAKVILDERNGTKDTQQLSGDSEVKESELCSVKVKSNDDQVDETCNEPSEIENQPKVRINIFDGICFPTKLVNGVVAMESNYDVTSQCLSLICEGSQSINWTNSLHTEDAESGKVVDSTEHVVESQTFFTDYVDLIHRDLGDDKLNFAFSYQFPPNLPSSFSFAQTVGKEIYGIIEYSFILLDIKENQVIAKRIMNLYEAPPYHYIPRPKADSMKIYYLSCINKGEIGLKAETDKGCYFFGDVAQIRCCILNHASEKISSIGVTMCRYLNFKDGKFNECKLRHIISHQQFKDVEGAGSGKSYETILNFELKGADTQHVSCSRFINCKYILRVSIQIKSQHDLFVDLDVILYKPNQGPEIKGSRLILEMKKTLSQISEGSESESVCSKSSNSELTDSATFHSENPTTTQSQNDELDEENIIGNLPKFPDDYLPTSIDSATNPTTSQSQNDIDEQNIIGSLPKFPEDYLPTSTDSTTNPTTSQSQNDVDEQNIIGSLPKFPDDYLPDDYSPEYETKDIIVEL